jgi:hypothetical protein
MRYSDRCLFSSLPPGKCRCITAKRATPASFQILSNSWFTCHPTIRCIQSVSLTEAHSWAHVLCHCAIRGSSSSRCLTVSKVSWRGHLELALLAFWIPFIHFAASLLYAASPLFRLLSCFILLFGRPPGGRGWGWGVGRPPVWPRLELALLPALKDRLWFLLFSFNL